MGEIANSEALTRIFGYWPTFHDAEVLRIRLDNHEGQLDERGHARMPSLEADIHVYEMTDKVTPDGFYELRHHTLVTLAFDGVADNELAGFSYQNALLELSLVDISDRQLEMLRWEIRFDASIGVSARLLCETVRVVSATPYEPNGARR